jgi:hypothetical protein
MRSWSSLVVGVAYASAAGSMAISVLWFTLTPGAEPAVETLGLVSCFTGVLVERRAAARERRHLAMAALAEELATCVTVLDDPRFLPREGTPLRPYVYPRLPTSAAVSVLISGALSDHRDVELLRRLHAWRESASGFNRRLDLTELRLFTVASHQEIGEFERALHRDDGYLNDLRRNVQNLLDYLGLPAPHDSAEHASSSHGLASLPRPRERVGKVA